MHKVRVRRSRPPLFDPTRQAFRHELGHNQRDFMAEGYMNYGWPDAGYTTVPVKVIRRFRHGKYRMVEVETTGVIATITLEVGEWQIYATKKEAVKALPKPK
jgi:hypothetical protein